MEKRTLGKTGIPITALGFGAAEIGFQDASQDTVNALLHAALDAGLNMIDTAECYKASEEMIGKAVAGRRKEFALFTKTGHMDDGDHWNPAKMAAQIDRSLERLQTDCVDLLQLHTCTEEQLRQGDVIDVLRRAKEAGKTRFIGYSGDSKAALYAVESGAFDTLQTSVSIADQEGIGVAIPAAHAAGMGIIAKRPIANAVWKTGAKPVNEYHHVYWDRLQELQYSFLKGDLDASISIALRFTLSIPGITTAIVGTQNPHRWKANARILDEGPLDAAQFDAIRARWTAVARPEWIGQT